MGNVNNFLIMGILVICTLYIPTKYFQKTPEPCIEYFDVEEEYVKITVYNPVPKQTSGHHLQTADGTIIDPTNLGKSVAISRDLIGRFNMGDSIQIFCNCPYQGKYIINDKLGPRAKTQIDVLSWKRTGLYYGKIQKKIIL
jgi:hypothetical protein